MVSYIVIAILLYIANSFLKNPKRLLNLIFKNKRLSKKKMKYAYKNLELGRFKLSKIVIKNMLKSNFIYPSDPYLSYEKYRKNFTLGLENYMLYKFPTADLKEINMKLNQIINNNLDYWLTHTQSIV